VCTILVTANPDHVFNAHMCPSFTARGNTHTIWGMDFGKKDDLIIPLTNLDVDEYRDPESIIGDKRLFILHYHAPTGQASGEHPVIKSIKAMNYGYNVTAALWHNGQLTKGFEGWDTQHILDVLVDEPAIWDNNLSLHHFIDWNALNQLEGTFSCVLMMDFCHIKYRNEAHNPEVISESKLFLFRNNSAPLVVRSPMSPVEKMDTIFMDNSTYFSSVPLTGDQAPGKVKPLPANTAYQVSLHRAGEEGEEPVFKAEPVAYFDNRYDPYGLAV